MIRTVLFDNCRVLDQQCVVPFVWVGRIIALSSRRLVPGDVVVLQRGKATCDMVLLRGAGLVEESMMSGEVSASLDDGDDELQAFQQIVLARYLLGGPKPQSCEPTCTDMRRQIAPKGCVLIGQVP